jgi:hypothetical protein
MTWDIDDSAAIDIDLDTPCRIVSVVGEDVGHVVINLECGTGAMMTTHTITIDTNAPIFLSPWVGSEVTFRYRADEVWWINRWFTVRLAGGTLLLAGVSADGISPPESPPLEWYAPLDVRILSGVCPPTDGTCGSTERQALEVSYGGATMAIFDGLSDYVGMMVSYFVFVSQATHVLEMGCDDYPDQFYRALFVLIPEG